MIGQRLKKLRDGKGLKQADVAEVLGVSRTTYTQYETEKSEPDLATVVKLAAFFGTSVDYLLCKTNIRVPIETITAHHDGDEFTEEELKDIEAFKEFVRSRRKQDT